MSKKKYIPNEWETVVCPFCDSAEFKLYEKYGCDFQFTYVKCSDCKLIYQSPRPKYDNDFLKAAYGYYMNYDPNYTHLDDSLRTWEQAVREILKFDYKRTALLDIGCAMGDFIYVAQKHYEYCHAIEVAENMAQFVRENLKIDVFQGSFIDYTSNRKYSCIHMSHVIEHIPNPKDWLKKSKDILDHDGILAISVPNMNSLERRFKLFLKRMGLRKGRWKEVWRTPDHLFEPTISSTLRFLHENGFRVLDYYTYSRNDKNESTFFGKIFHRKLKLGSNLRFFATHL
jgi:SAM-dependent methyltransferase